MIRPKIGQVKLHFMLFICTNYVQPHKLIPQWKFPEKFPFPWEKWYMRGSVMVSKNHLVCSLQHSRHLSFSTNKATYNVSFEPFERVNVELLELAL